VSTGDHHQCGRVGDLGPLLCHPNKEKTLCIYDAPSPEAIRKVARKNNLPVDKITAVSVLDLYFYR
jgi:hypothetical protein